MKRLWCFSLCILVLLFAASCSNKEKCDCCGDILEWDDAYILTSCYYDESRELHCALCKSCYQDAMHSLVENFNGSMLEEYLLEYLVDNFSGSELEKHLIESNVIKPHR